MPVRRGATASRPLNDYFSKHRETEAKNSAECGCPALLEVRLRRNVLKHQSAGENTGTADRREQQH